ncbi:PRC-barrel domain-containing protein [Fertoeibacter niger]|nr:PRC-barrel domain-containing protein [Fertoeibacter niger]
MQTQPYAAPTQTTAPNPMVSSGDVNGARVYSPTGDHLGNVDHLMIDKQSGRVAYAVMSFGGFLGIGADHTPLPWGKLRYDVQLDGYVTDITKEQLEAAPAVPEDWQRDRTWGQTAHDHYGVAPYWM